MSSVKDISELTQANTRHVLRAGLYMFLAGWLICLGASFVADQLAPPPSDDISQAIKRDWYHGCFTFPYYFIALVLDMLVVFFCVVALSTGVLRARAVALIVISILSLAWHGLTVSILSIMR